MTPFGYGLDKITGFFVPGKYPGESSDKWSLPDTIRTTYNILNSIITTKYTREYLKICAFYNKMFPSLRTQSWARSTYNSPSFTGTEQERSDTGTGISSNYLKQIIDQTVSRLGTISFDAMLIEDVPSIEYVVYKDEVERLLRKRVRNEYLNQLVMECFHDAAIVGYSHIMVNPVTHDFIKVNDYELGIHEAQLNKDDVKQCLYRDYEFPVTGLVPYIALASKETAKKVIEEYGTKATVDLKIYIDCSTREFYITIGGTTLEPQPYPFDKVQLVTFSWDIGFSKVTSTSLFDLLYPTQRELNKVNNKIQQLIRMYKGPVPIFPNDVDLAMKQITNGSGECLYVDSKRPVDQLISIINPTPLDPQLSATKQELKTELYELAGIQQVSLDMENFRSAAAVIAMDQTRDTVFQAQVDGIATFVKKIFRMYIEYNLVTGVDDSVTIDWKDIAKLVNNATIEIKPIHVNDPLGNQNAATQLPVDYQQIAIARTTLAIARGQLSWEQLPFHCNKQLLKVSAAQLIVKLAALGLETPETLHQFMIDAFIEDYSIGAVQI